MSELQPLTSLLVLEREIEVPFAAFLNSEPVVVTAVLERTAVYHGVNDSERYVVLLEHLQARPRDVNHAGLKTTIWHGRRKG
jgi:hypothetical protein